MASEAAKKAIIEWQYGSEADGEWYHRGNDDYVKILDRLLDLGITEEDGLDILQSAYYIAANEFGG